MPDICPNCGKSFPNSSRVLGHMNHPYSRCKWYFVNQQKKRHSDLEDVPESSSPPSPTSLVDSTSESNSEMSGSNDNQDPGPPSSPLTESQYFPDAGKTFGYGANFMSMFDTDVHAGDRDILPFYPFASKDEFELASWISRAGLSMKLQDEFFKLKLIQNIDISFKSAKVMRSRMELLPKAPEWKFRTISIPGYATEQPMILYYRDSFEVLKMLLSNPLLAGHIDFNIRKSYAPVDSSREYGEWVTSDGAWFMQSRIPIGGTLIGTVLSSDKTTITSMSGDRVAHPLLLSAANIHMDTRMKASSHSLPLVAFIPCPKFVGVKKGLKGVLENRLLHLSLDIVCAPLKRVCRYGDWISDPLGQRRFGYTPIASYIADSPEAAALACVGGGNKTSYLTMADYRQFGDSFRHEPRTASTTLAQLHVLASDPGLDPWDLEQYSKAAKERFRLNGVHLPFWRNWCLPDGTVMDPGQFLTPEPLHHWHKMFFDHDMKWSIRALGVPEINFRFSVLQPRNGYRSFKSGVSRLKQVTCRETRDMQRYLVGVLVGGTPKEFILCIRGLMDLRYLAQGLTLNQTDLDEISAALKMFHDNKHIILQLGLRVGAKNRRINHFQIPKLELLQSIVASIIWTGATLQWSADPTERAHITVVKVPAEYMNNKEHAPQICRHLDREEKRRLFDLATSIRRAGIELMDLIDPDDPDALDIESSNWTSELDTAEKLAGTTRPIPNLFTTAEASRVQLMLNPSSCTLPLRTFCSATTAFHLNVRPHIRRTTIDDISKMFNIPDLHTTVANFLENYLHDPDTRTIGGRRPRPSRYSEILPFREIAVWYSVEVQTNACDGSGIVKPQKLFASPPSTEWPLGRYDTALFARSVDSDENLCPPSVGLPGLSVGQFRLIFHPHWNIKTPAPLYLAYIHRFDVVRQARTANHPGGSIPDPVSGMYTVRRAVRSDQTPMGDLIPLLHCRIPAHLVPRFGEKADPRLVFTNSLEYAKEHSLNKYFDKDFYQYLRRAGRVVLDYEN